MGDYKSDIKDYKSDSKATLHAARRFFGQGEGISIHNLKQYLGNKCISATKSGVNCNRSFRYVSGNETLDCTDYCRTHPEQWIMRMLDTLPTYGIFGPKPVKTTDHRGRVNTNPDYKFPDQSKEDKEDRKIGVKKIEIHCLPPDAKSKFSIDYDGKFKVQIIDLNNLPHETIYRLAAQFKLRKNVEDVKLLKSIKKRLFGIPFELSKYEVFYLLCNFLKKNIGGELQIIIAFKKSSSRKLISFSDKIITIEKNWEKYGIAYRYFLIWGDSDNNKPTDKLKIN